jgi:hypothetical protein
VWPCCVGGAACAGAARGVAQPRLAVWRWA